MHFSPHAPVADNQFIKSKPAMLNQFYGSTDVFPYWVADMDFSIAKPISDELQRLVSRGVYSYEFIEKAVFEAISNWHLRRHQITLSPEHFVQVPGVLSGIALLLRQLTDKGDAVMIQSPAYHQFSGLITKAQRTLIKNDLQLIQGEYQLDLKGMEQQIIDNQVKAMIFCNPHNPTGRVWTRAELADVVAIAQRHNVLIISDEIHADIIYQGNVFTSLTQFESDNIITLLGSPAKTFGMHSISHGYIYINNPDLHGKIKQHISDLYLDHANALSSYATVAAYQHGDAWLDDMMAYLQGTLDWINDFIKQHIPRLRMYQPQGTYQVWFDFSGLELSEDQLTQQIFKQAKMGLTPGAWFGEQSGQFMRMNIATKRENIMGSFELLKQALTKGAANGAIQNHACQQADIASASSSDLAADASFGKSNNSCC
ncbi:MalY/PatB family protein [Shewanella maritima]|uniref:MalY/PatB family protein n=1 Tax=Shewanella maritima TaxID=2520507 RepID=UPI0037361D08